MFVERGKATAGFARYGGSAPGGGLGGSPLLGRMGGAGGAGAGAGGGGGAVTGSGGSASAAEVAGMLLSLPFPRSFRRSRDGGLYSLVRRCARLR